MERIADTTISASEYGSGTIVIEQDEDTILVRREDIEEFAAAVRKHGRTTEGPDPAPKKWYVVLKNSNYRLTNSPGVPTTFTTYGDARIYARIYTRNFGGLERIYCPISADEYERAFGR